jgi:hypothetical protein
MVMMPPTGAAGPAGPPMPPPGAGGPGGPGGGPMQDPRFAAALKLALPMIQAVMVTLSPEDVQRVLAGGPGPGRPGPMPGGAPRPMTGRGPMGGPMVGARRAPGASPMRQALGAPRRAAGTARAAPGARGRVAAPVRRTAPKVAPRSATRRR